eukprot:jgi/Chlat1/1859/Chrsp141S02191
MPAFRTAYNGYGVAFSPFEEGRLAVATAQNFGIIGNGRQYVLQLAPNGLVEVAAFDTADGLYDCCWSEENENLLVSASGDGSVKVWDLAAPPSANPLRSFEEHTHEVYCVAWNTVRRDCFLSASWDDTLKLWSLRSAPSLRTFAEHSYCVYSASWNPVEADVFASASGDTTVRIWDVRVPHATLTIPAHQYEVLSCDWSKYNDCILATGSVDKTIKVWDVRMPEREMTTLHGHTYAVRRVKCSPHRETPEDALIARYDHHTEFAVGMDMSVLVDGMLASTGWDEMTYVWQQGADPRAA